MRQARVPVGGSKIAGNGPLASFGPGLFAGQDGLGELCW